MGLVSMLNFAKQQLAIEDPLHTDRVVEIVRESRARAEATYASNPLVLEHVREATCWMFSYLTSSDPAHPTPQNSEMRLALSHPTHDYRLELIPANSVCVGFPDGVTPVDAFYDEAHSQMRPMTV